VACGAENVRAIPQLPGMDLEGVHYAMPYLVQQNRRVGGESPKATKRPFWAGGKHVVVIGGGDTASDCIGTAFRQGALSVTQLDIRPIPPLMEDKLTIWPYWPTKLPHVIQPGRRRRARIRCRNAGHGRQTRMAVVTKRELHSRVDEKREPIEGTDFYHPRRSGADRHRLCQPGP
jgi:glutamate synthase (NADPH/NADH) small chain